jgi:HEAT repeat protein
MNSAVLLLIAIGAGAIQAPQIQNGRVETRQATAIDTELARVAAGSVEPVWAGWRVPIADGQRGSCSTYSNDSYYVRGEFLENGPFNGGNSPQLMAPPAGPVQLEATSALVILVRMADGRVERLRSIGADCPLDAGGRTVYWLQGPTPVESVKYLESLLRPNTGITPAQEQRLSAAAVSAIALHRDPSADAVLDRLAMADTDSDLRRAARSSLGSVRGAHGFAVLRQLVDRERVPDIRRQLVGALGLTRQTGTVDALLQIARRDSDAKVRGEAAYWLPQRGGPRAIPDVAAIINGDNSDVVKQRAIQGLARLTADEATSLLIQLARTTSSAAVRKEAVTALGRSRDPKALAYMEELIKGSLQN